MSTINRKICVYRTQANYFEEKEGDSFIKPYAANMTAVFDYIKHLPFARDENPNVYMGSNDEKIAVKIFDADDSVATGHLAKIRYDALSQIEQFGELSFMALPDNAGQYDPAHFVYFPEDGFVLFEANRNAPQISKLSTPPRKRG